MKTIARGLAVWLAAAALAPAAAAAAAAEPATAPVGRSFSLGVHLAYWDLSRLDGLDLDGALLEAQRAMGWLQRQPFLAGDHHQRMGFAGQPPLGRQQGVRIGARHQPVGHQPVENLDQA